MEMPERAVDFPVPRKMIPLLDAARFKGLHGGRASAKSHFFAERMIERAIWEPGLRAVCLREHQKSLQHSSKQLLEDKIEKYDLGDQFEILDDIIRTDTDGLIIFQGMQNHTAESIKSLERFQIAWFDEAQRCSARSLKLLIPTIRSPGSELWFSWNPNKPTDPVDQLLRGPKRRPNSIVVQANYMDNPWCPKEMRDEAEYMKAHDIEDYDHIWLGGYLKRSKANVFTRWRVGKVPDPGPGTVLYFGADWGYAVDPSVLVCCYIIGRQVFIWRSVYKVGCETEDLPALFDALVPDRPGFARAWPVTADSARPETISYMRRKGGYKRMRPSIKGANSLLEGVEFLRSYEIIVDPSCVEVIDELENYKFMQDPLTEEVLPVLEDKKNHTIDSVRYAIERFRRAKMGLIG